MKIRKRTFTLKSGENLVLRSPIQQDAKQLADYNNKVVAETNFLFHSPLDGKATEKKEKEFLKRHLTNNNLIIVAEIEGKIIGITEFTQGESYRGKHYSTFGISVMKKFWRKGIANILLKTLLKEIKKTDLEYLELYVDEKNTVARYLYTKYGFKEYGIKPNKVKYEDGTYSNLIFMVKDLKN